MSRIANDGHAAALTLELHAQRAGAALAWVYSSSAEYEAALIAERRAAGVYGPKRHASSGWPPPLPSAQRSPPLCC